MKTLLIVAFLALILYNLGAGLYYMLLDRGSSKRTVNALTRRIALSVALIVLVIVGIASGLSGLIEGNPPGQTFPSSYTPQSRPRYRRCAGEFRWGGAVTEVQGWNR